MPVPRHRASLLGHSSADCPVTGGTRPVTAGTLGGRVTVSSCVSGPRMLAAPGTGTRVTRRALGISSVFLQGTRTSPAPVVPKTGPGPGLGWTLVDYREKVQALEKLNFDLEENISRVLQQRAQSATYWSPLREEWESVYRQVSEAILSNARLMLQTENVQASAEDFRDRYESERPFRKALEEEIRSLHRVIDEAHQTRLELQDQLQTMWTQIQDLTRNHHQDVRRLYTQMCGPAEDLDEPDSELGLDQVLDLIRTHWERVCEQNRLQTNQHQNKEVSGGSPQQEQVEGLRAEVHEAGVKLQSLQAQTESIRALKRGLEASLVDARHWQELELQNLGAVVTRLEAELSEVRTETENQRRDLDTLRSNKHRLEQEISLYHGLLEGEERRYQQDPEGSGGATVGATGVAQAMDPTVVQFSTVQTEPGSAPAEVDRRPQTS